MRNLVGVVIPTYNRVDTLARVIDSYIEQENLGEIVLVNDHSTEDYTELINEISVKTEKRGVKLKYIVNSQNMGAFASRYVGIQNAESEYILWGEDDAFLSSDYIQVLMENMENNSIVEGRIIYGVNPEDSDAYKKEKDLENARTIRPCVNLTIMEGHFGVKPQKVIEIPFGHALYMAPRKLLLSLDYSQSYPVNGYREETDLQIQISKKKFRILFVPFTKCFHMRKGKDVGGQHSHNQLKYEFYKVKNTWTFFDKYYDFLKEKYRLPFNRTFAKMIYLLYAIEDAAKKVVYQLISAGGK